MELFTYDTNESERLALVCDQHLSDPRYLPLAEAPEATASVNVAYLRQMHHVANMRGFKMGLFDTGQRHIILIESNWTILAEARRLLGGR